MPGGDRTGPAGMGPMTGRGAGYCAGYAAPGYMNPGVGRGAGFGWGRRGGGRGFGRGWGRGAMGYAGAAMPMPMPMPMPYAGVPSREQEIEMLSAQAEGLEQALSDIRGRMSELEKTKK